MWSHDEQKHVTRLYVETAYIKCPHCNAPVKKYVESWYTGGHPCVLLTKYCRFCGSSLNNN